MSSRAVGARRGTLTAPTLLTAIAVVVPALVAAVWLGMQSVRDANPDVPVATTGQTTRPGPTESSVVAVLPPIPSSVPRASSSVAPGSSVSPPASSPLPPPATAAPPSTSPPPRTSVPPPRTSVPPPRTSAPPVATTVPAEPTPTEPEPASAEPVPTSVAPGPPLVVNSPATTVPPTAPVTIPIPIPVTTIQTAPPVRDVVVVIDGAQFSTDGHGTIDVPDVEPSAVVTVVGALNDPPIQEVEVLGWADDSGDAPRTVGSLAGPVAYVRLALRSRVTVVLDPATGRPAAVTFDTEHGPVPVPTDTPTWLLDRRALRGTTPPTVEQMHYTARAIETDGNARLVEGQTFIATPEALWAVRTVPR